MSPLTIKLIAILALAGSLIGVGWKVCSWKHDADDTRAYKAAIEAGNKVSVKLEAITSTLDKKQRQTVKEVAHETVKDAYRCPVPADGIRLFNASANPASQPSNTLPPR